MFLDGNLNVDFNTKLFSVTKNSVDEGGALGNAISMDPTKPIYDESADNRFAPYYQNTNVRKSIEAGWSMESRGVVDAKKSTRERSKSLI